MKEKRKETPKKENEGNESSEIGNKRNEIIKGIKRNKKIKSK